MFLLDTNVLSESTRPNPDKNVMRWLEETDEDDLFVSVISIAELQRGIELMPQGRRRSALTVWLATDLIERLGSRFLPVTLDIGETWGMLTATEQKSGFILDPMDAFLAATAKQRQLTLVTRNVRDFQRLGIPLLNPWLGTRA